MNIRIIAFKFPILHSFRSETFLLCLRVRIMSSWWKAQLSHQVSLDGWEERCCWYERAAVWRCRSRYECREVLFPAQCRVAWKANEFHKLRVSPNCVTAPILFVFFIIFLKSGLLQKWISQMFNEVFEGLSTKWCRIPLKSCRNVGSRTNMCTTC